MSERAANFVQRARYTLALAAAGGGLLAPRMFGHQPPFITIVMGALGAILGIALLAPPQLSMTATSLRFSSLGYTWIDVPWTSISGMALFESARGEALGIDVNLADRPPPKLTPSTKIYYGHDIIVTDRWSRPLSEVVEEARHLWVQAGGSGKIDRQISPSPLNRRQDALEG